MRLNELLDSAMSLISALDLMEADCDLEDTCHSQKLSQRREGVRRFLENGIWMLPPTLPGTNYPTINGMRIFS